MDGKNQIELDPEAQRLFEQLGGLQAHERPTAAARIDHLAQSLLEEQKRHDAIRILMVQAAWLLSRYLANQRYSAGNPQEQKVFGHLRNALHKLSQLPGHLGCLLIRYRGVAASPDVPEKYDYELVFGHHSMDSVIVPHIVRRNGMSCAKLPNQFLEACTVLADYGVNNIFVRLSESPDDNLTDYRLCLKILAGFREARHTGNAIRIGDAANVVSVPLINDENLFPDPNLTLVAGLNRLSAKSMESLVDKVDRWLRRQTTTSAVRRYAGVYNAALELPQLNAKIKKPPVELNNVKWLISDTETQSISVEKVRIAQLVMDMAAASPQQAAKMIKSVYGDDFNRIDAMLLGERLHLSSNLLHAAGKRANQGELTQELLGNLQTRLDQVRDHVIDDIHVVADTGTERQAGKEPPKEAVDQRIYRMVSFYKGRSATRKKMVGMVHHPIQFGEQDYQILAKDFRISRSEAEALVHSLKSCFSNEGNFKKSGFAEAVPQFCKYEQKIFQFLWHHMKDVVLPADRVAFLNALQALTARMNQPKKAFKILLEDLCDDPTAVQFSDNKAVMLANLIMHRDKSLTDYEMTPEDVVLSRHQIDAVVAEYAAWRIEKEHEAFSTKVQTIHKKMIEALHLGQTSGQQIPAAMLINLERELYIFLSMVDSDTSRAILRSAASEYGDPTAEIYRKRESGGCLSSLVQNLRVALRGVGTQGGQSDIPLLEAVKASEETFGRLKNDRQYRAQVRHITEWVNEAVKLIRFHT